MDLKIFAFFILAAVFSLAASQSTSNSKYIIDRCYQNNTAYNRWTRQPMHIENLIAIIRKIEEKTDYLWDNRRLSRTLIAQFQFDGLNYDSLRKPGYEYDLSSEEAAHMAIIRETIPASETLPEGILSNDEICSLHWMLSHSINATMRDDESTVPAIGLRWKRDARWPSDAEQWGLSRSKSESERATNYMETQIPIETGIVLTKWGAVAAGKLLGGIAAGLEPFSIPVSVIQGGYSSNGYVPLNIPTNTTNGFNVGTGAYPPASFSNFPRYQPQPLPYNRNGGWAPGRGKRQVSGSLPALINYHAATLAGDVGQAAMLNAVWQNPSRYSPPTGEFNDTICPREYVMHALPDSTHDASHVHDTWSFMTTAEIRGGVDGLVLGRKMQEWVRYEYRLSDFLSMYYSEKGITGEYRYRACNRASLFNSDVNANELLDQAKSFAYIYSNRTKTGSSVDLQTVEGLQLLYQLVQETHNKMMGTVGSFASVDTGCSLRENSGSELPEADKTTTPKLTVYAVLDPTEADMTQQKRFIAQLAFELGVSPVGSRLGLVNGATGQILIKPNSTSNPSTLACDILSQRTVSQTQSGVLTTLNNLYDEIKRLKDEEERSDYADDNGIVILVMNQGPLIEETAREDARSKIYEYRDNLGDVQVIYASSKYQNTDYEELVMDTDYDFIRIQNVANLSTEAGRFVTDLVKKTHGRITYPRCNKDRYEQSNENLLPKNLFLSPNTLEYYKISADYFYSAKELQLRFISTYGKVRVCMSRSTRLPNNANADTSDKKEKDKDVVCKETLGTGSTEYTEFVYEKPCGKNGKRQGCGPIYVSLSPITTAIGLDCREEGCQSPDQVKVTFNHWDMRCNGAVNLVVSAPGFFVAALLTIFTFVRYS